MDASSGSGAEPEVTTTDGSPFMPKFFEHLGVRILRLDFTGIPPAQLPSALAVCARVVSSEPQNSLRILTTLGTRFNELGVEALRRYLEGNKPYVRWSAVVAKGFSYAIVLSAKREIRKDIQLFTEVDKALEWIATQ